MYSDQPVDKNNEKDSWEPVSYDPFAFGPELEITLPTTEAQKEIWGALQFADEANLAYNESICISMRGLLEVSALQKSMQAVIQRHQSLRAFVSLDGKILCIAKQLTVPLPLVEISSHDDSTKTFDSALRKWLRQELCEAFPKTHGPLVRAHLIKHHEQHHVLVFTAHHIICDGWSLGLIVEELSYFYNHFLSRKNFQKALPAADSFSDFVIKAENDHQSKMTDLNYWRQQHQLLTDPLDLPTKSHRPISRSFHAKRYDFRFSPDCMAAIKQFCAKKKLSLVSFLMACYALSLGRLSRQDHLVIGVPASGQAAQGQFRLVGHCVNLLPIPWTLQGQIKVSEFLTAAKNKILDAYEHQNISFGQLIQNLQIKRSENRIPLVNVLFNYDQKLPAELYSMQGLEVEYWSNPRFFENFEVFLNLLESNTSLSAQCYYNCDLFHENLIQQICLGIQEFAIQMLSDEEQCLQDLSLPRDARISQWNQLTVRSREYLTLADAIDLSCQAFADKIAINDGKFKITYAQLKRRSDQLASYLQAAGLGQGKAVGIRMERNHHLPVALLGVLKAGAFYVPLDPRFPEKRLAMMIEDASLQTIIVCQEQARLAPADKHLVNLDEFDWEQSFTAPSPLPVDHASQAAYLLFTSGSTGRPKGVLISHQSVINFLQSMAQQPGLDAHDRFLAITTISFDISVLEIFLPLLQGAYLRIAGMDETLDRQKILDVLAGEGITMMQATPATWRMIFQGTWTLKQPFTALCGGETLSPDLAPQFHTHGIRLWNMYGPTETTVWSSYQLIQPNQNINIGKPIANTQIEITDQYGHPLPVGAWGEVLIGGQGLAIGYYKRDDLTEEKFIHPPWSEQKWYRTGDIGRYLENGELELLGRIDQQVKIRGFRIELDDISYHLRQHPDIHDAIAIADDVPQLIAYYCSQKAIRPEVIVAYLKEMLPFYMIPQFYVALDSLPKLPNGKINRGLLPPPQTAVVAEQRATHEMEEELKLILENPLGILLKTIWEDHLNVIIKSAKDDFFLQGGHSLLAAQVIAEIQQQCGRQLKLRNFFRSASFSDIYQQLILSEESVHSSIPRRHSDDKRVSSWQKRMWYVEQIDPDTRVHNLPAAWRIRGKLDAAIFMRAFQHILAQHDAMRMSFQSTEDDVQQLTHEPIGNECEWIDWRSSSSHPAETELLADLQKLAFEKIKIDQYPLFRARLYSLDNYQSIFFFMAHHMIWDGWCFDIFLDELAHSYQALQNNQNLPPPPPVSYADFSSWQLQRLQEDAMEQARQYWRQQFQEIPEPLDIPTDFSRPAEFQADSQTILFELNAQQTMQLEQYCQRNTLTPFMVFMASYALMLHAFSEQIDLVIGNPVRGRSRQDLEKLLGAFINVLPFRFQFSRQDKIKSFLNHVKTVCLQAQQYGELPFDEILHDLAIPRDASRTPLFSAMFSYQDVSRRQQSLAQLALEQIFIANGSVHTDLMLWVKKSERQVAGGLDFRTDLWLEHSASSMLSCFQHILEQVISGDHRLLGELSWIAAPRYQDMKKICIAPSIKEPLPSPITVLISQHAVHQPQSIALEYRDSQLSYAQLENRVLDVSAALCAAGINPGDFVGICMNRDIDLVSVMLAILRSGAAYVPLDPQLPKDRILSMVEDAAMKVIICHTEHGMMFDEQAARVIIVEDIKSSKEESSSPHTGDITPEQAAYLIYTSGSTGRPKGVKVSHGALAHFLSAFSLTLPISNRDRVLALTTISFDISILEIFLPLIHGATIHLLDAKQSTDPDQLASLIHQKNISLMQATPASWQLLQIQSWPGKKDLRALCGGETLNPELARFLLPRTAELWNVYGPTEATIWATTQKITDADSIQVGLPLPGYQAWILNDEQQIVPQGAKGQLYLGGSALATSYLNQPELTREKFVEHRKFGRLYQTGDIARIHGTRNFELLGRSDFQVKVRGFRMELGEIENQILLHPQVQQACVLVREDQQDDQRLVAYVSLKDRQLTLTLKELLSHLNRNLPHYMLPHYLVILDQFPLTNSGKIDRKKLPPPHTEQDMQTKKRSPQSPSQERIVSIFAKHLKQQNIGIDDQFFDLGGYSLLAIKVLAELNQEQIQQKFLLRHLLLENIEQLATRLESSNESDQAVNQSNRSWITKVFPWGPHS
ncbi:MAG: amino acid adenylation domain-containing protein [Oligoflexus sp.]